MPSSTGQASLRKGPGKLTLSADTNDVLDCFGRRWVPQLLFLLAQGEARFTELANLLPGLSRRMLTERLRELDAEGVIRRTVEPGPPTRISYVITEPGRQRLAELARAVGGVSGQTPVIGDDDRAF